MFGRSSRRSRSHLFGALALLVILAAMLPLGAFLAGVLSGGGRDADPSKPAERADESGALRVTVLNALDRSPVEGARILVRGLTGGEMDAASDPDGRATVDGLGTGPVRVEATWRGGRASAWADPRIEHEVLLAVPPSATRSGHVCDESGEPVDAVLRLLGPEGEEIATTRTDEYGRYELPDEPEARSLCVESADAAPAVAIRGDVVVSEGVLLEGRLAGAGEGALHVFGSLPSPHDDATLPFRCVWPVDGDGAFRGRLPEGVRAWGLFEGLPVRIAPGELALPDRATAHGRVIRAEDGGGVAGAVLLLRPSFDRGGLATPLPGVKVETNELGGFDADGFARIRYSAEVRAPGRAARIVPEVIPGEEAIEIALEPGYAVGGFVVDAAGLPVPDAQVRAVGVPDAAGERPVLKGRTDQKGRFLIEGLGGDHARVRVEAPGHHPTTLEGVRDKTDLSVVLQKR